MKYLAFIALFLFCFGYWICDLFFVNGSIAWWDLRIAIYTIIFGLCFTTCYLLTKGLVKAIFLVAITFCIGDIVDRYIFNINELSWNDTILYGFGLTYLSIFNSNKELV